MDQWCQQFVVKWVVEIGGDDVDKIIVVGDYCLGDDIYLIVQGFCGVQYFLLGFF